MKIYILKKPKEKVMDYESVGFLDTHEITVKGGDYYEARKEAFRHAHEHQRDRFMVIVNGTLVLHRPHWNGVGTGPLTRVATANDMHGLYHYMNRLLGRFGHVYVPYVDRHKQNPQEWHYLNSPTIPVVAGYQTKALSELGDFGSTTGFRLCSAGYDSFTVSDYFWRDADSLNTVMDTLDEYGSGPKWEGAFQRGIGQLISRSAA